VRRALARDEERNRDLWSERRDRLERAVAGGLRSAIHDHGPITADWIGSTVKRVVGALLTLDELREVGPSRRRRKS
jgi:hypothetical protein